MSNVIMGVFAFLRLLCGKTVMFRILQMFENARGPVTG